MTSLYITATHIYRKG